MRKISAATKILIAKQWLVLCIIALCLSISSSAQTTPITLNLLPQTQTDKNYRLGAVAAFSVSYVPDQYRLYGTTWIQRNRWKPNVDAYWDYFYESNFTYPGQFTPAVRSTDMDKCDVSVSPLFWNPRCIDAIGLFTKRVVCVAGMPNYACQNNDLWNAYPGRSNMSTFPVRPPANDAGFGWPSQTSWGVKNYQPIITHKTVNSVQPNPPSSGKESECHPSNPNELATGTQNAKAVQVKLANGATRWFMAYNNQVHYELLSNGYNAQDMWRVQWAYSDDGLTWNAESRPLFLDLTEKGPGCDRGLYVMDMFVDNGYFYIVANRVYLDHLWFIRAKIDMNASAGPGYDPNSWEVRGTYDAATGKHRWASIPASMLGTHVDFTALGGEPILPTRFGVGHYGGALKHTIISRVFTSSAPNSPSQYIALTVDQNQTNPPSAPIVELWAANSLDQPFVYQSNVNLPNGGYGYEMSFVRYVDNTPATPRVFDNNFELWISHAAACEGIANCCPFETPQGSCPAGTSYPPSSRAPSQYTVSRRFARLTGGIFGN